MRTVLFVLLLLLAAPAFGKGKSNAGGETFTAPSALDAEDQPNGKPAFKLEAGHSYPVLKHGGPGGAWCKLDGGGHTGWVPCDGSGGGDKPAVTSDDRDDDDRRPSADDENPKRKKGRGGGSGSCLTSCDHAPLFAKQPSLSPLDREILSICPARPDVSVSAPDVRKFLSAHYDDQRLQLALSAAGRPGSGAGVKEKNLDWLTGLWVSTGPRNAFTHVFCGDDWTGDKLGGLHFLPRYAQLESEGKVCYGGPAKGGEPVKGGQYLIKYKGVSPWSCGTKKIGGFPVEHDPVSVIAVATRAFARCCERSGEHKEGGVYAAPDLGGVSWRIWCNSRNGTYGIASMYPTDEKPTCRE